MKSLMTYAALIAIPLALSACASGPRMPRLDTQEAPNPQVDVAAATNSRPAASASPGAVDPKREVFGDTRWENAGFRTASEANAYLARYPNGPMAEEARQSRDRFDDQAWARAQAADTILAYETYADSYRNGRHVADARRMISQNLDATKSQDATACQTFLDSDFGTGATPGSLLAQMREKRRVELCGETY